MRSVASAELLRLSWVSLRLVLERFQGLASLRRSVHSLVRQEPIVATSAKRELLIDVSVLADHDAGSGIQRVTKELLRELSAAPPDGYVARTVRASRFVGYRYSEGSSGPMKVRPKPGDVFLGLDFAPRIVPRHRLQLLHWHSTGVRICVVMHDLLPLLQPNWFTRRNARAYRQWIRAVAVHADSVACVSRSVADQFRIWLARQGFDQKSAPQVGWFHHSAQLPMRSQPPRIDGGVLRIAPNCFALMVGTIEPRKGYSMVLDAFEALWRDRHPIQLVIVGRIGWKATSLVARLRSHTEIGHRLHWFDDAGDDTLHALYAQARGVILASEGEGFGLPILEAALHGKPLLVRNLSIFREIAGDGATYFRGENAAHFAQELRVWLERVMMGTAVSSATIALQPWAESARQLLVFALPIRPPDR